MSQATSSFSANISDPARQIAYYTILSELPLLNKIIILWYALEHDEPRDVFGGKIESRPLKFWETYSEEAFSGLNECMKSKFLHIKSWYNNVKGDDVVCRIFEEMRHRLYQHLPEQAQEATDVSNSQVLQADLESHHASKHCAPRVKKVEQKSSQDEEMYWGTSGAKETIKIDFDRSRHQGQGFRKNVGQQTAERTSNSSDHEVSNSGFLESPAVASAYLSSISPSPSSESHVQNNHPPKIPASADQTLDRNRNSLTPSEPSATTFHSLNSQPDQSSLQQEQDTEQETRRKQDFYTNGVLQVQNIHPPEVPAPAVRTPGRYEKNETEARYEKNYRSIGETLTEAGDNTRCPNGDQTFDRNRNSLTPSGPPTAFQSLNSQPDQSSLLQEQDTEQETRRKQDFYTNGVLQVQDNHPPEVPAPAVRTPGRYEKNETEARYEKNYRSIGETLTEAGDNTRCPNGDQTFDRNRNSLTPSGPPTAFQSLNSQPDQSSLLQEQDTEQETRRKQDFYTNGVLQVQDNHPPEVPAPAVRTPGRYEKNETEARYEKNYRSIGETLTEAGDNTRCPNGDQTFDRNRNSLTPSGPPTAFQSFNSQPDQSSLLQEQDTEQGQDTRIKQDFYTDGVPQEDVYNVLLLGETGVGKTTFINSCANYIKFDSMEDALAGGPKILIDSTFTVSEAVGISKITVRATTGAGNSINEHTEKAGESRTQEPLIHKMTWIAENGKRKLLRIIDTPGVNDTRGQDQDGINFKKVLHLIQSIGNLHAICLLLKPNESVMSVGFRRSLDYFLTKLHSSALKNILFCFTNTRSTFYLPGETYTLLETYFEDLKAANGIEITLTLSNVFCFENDCFRYMCLLMNDGNRVKKHHEQIVRKSWEHNVPEIRKFLARIQRLNPHLTEDTTNMDTVSELLSKLARPLMETMQSLVDYQHQVVSLREKINMSTQSEVELRKLMHTQKKVLKKRFLQCTQLICIATTCSSSCYLNDGTLVYQPSKPCHYQCHYLQLKRDRQNQQMTSCQVFSKDGFCAKCHHNKHTHQYIDYELYLDTEDIIHEDVRQKLRECTSETEQQRIMLESLNEILDQLNTEVNAIKSACIEFSAFLLYSSLKAGADPYSIYLGILIRNERDKQAGNELYNKLEEIFKQHNLDVQPIVQSVRTRRQPKLTYGQINTKIDYLRSLPNSGRKISKILEGIAESIGSNGDQQFYE